MQVPEKFPYEETKKRLAMPRDEGLQKYIAESKAQVASLNLPRSVSYFNKHLFQDVVSQNSEMPEDSNAKFHWFARMIREGVTGILSINNEVDEDEIEGLRGMIHPIISFQYASQKVPDVSGVYIDGTSFFFQDIIDGCFGNEKESFVLITESRVIEYIAKIFMEVYEDCTSILEARLRLSKLYGYMHVHKEEVLEYFTSLERAAEKAWKDAEVLHGEDVEYDDISDQIDREVFGMRYRDWLDLE